MERLEHAVQGVLRGAGKVTPKKGYTEVRLDSVRLALWWEACGFAKHVPPKGTWARATRRTCPTPCSTPTTGEVYAAFLRGLYEADGDTSAGYPTLKNTSLQLVRDVQTMLLALGIPATLSIKDRVGGTSWGTSPLATLRTLNASYSARWLEEIGFMGDRKNGGVRVADESRGQTGSEGLRAADA